MRTTQEEVVDTIIGGAVVMPLQQREREGARDRER